MTNCRSCGAAILWITTAKGKKMPIDAVERAHLNEGQRRIHVFDRDGKSVPIEPGKSSVGHLSHFATCPDAQKHRKKR